MSVRVRVRVRDRVGDGRHRLERGIDRARRDGAPLVGVRVS